MTKVQVHVTHRAGVFESTANHAITRSLTAPTLAALHKRVTVVATLARRCNEPVVVTFDLDAAAQAEAERQSAAAGIHL